ncbi:hypothetical protein [Mycolicibacterium mageritense]|uniref:hypothetical protein n=1 Tax=Mycolicibacterium mageritense TaxID=53462 RepID=UPI001E508D40|nr:hypothetical protein [Mycolicibacterium mageritense]MCC9182592.1 hypothetical protein [Mycolicibacterium mageritense]
MDRIPLLEDCNFYTYRIDDGRFIGRVREFRDLRTRPRANALDASDEIITHTRNKIANLTAAVALVAIQQRNRRP